MEKVRVGKRYQVVIPAAIRKKTKIKVGDEMLLEVDKSGNLYLIPQPQSYTNTLKGLGEEIWENVDPLSYQRSEREEKDRDPQ
ncbi:MAG: AbrB/MazE/SpoVT family DNA-binding domain-containing protein [Bacillota bacterium]|nr:AbrB/MazE/SpoVT family DNA-binding domain-containing protein [Bacillota bacterium]